MTRIKSTVLALVAASSFVFSLPAEAQTAFDGRWWVNAVGDPSQCTDRYLVPIRVKQGHISGAFFSAVAAGDVNGSGKLVLRLADVRATGALATRSGRGQWKSPTCFGTWTARRA